MGSLVDVVQDKARRRAVIDDCAQLIESEVADKKGVSGLAVKASFSAVKKVRPGMIGMAMDGLLDDFSRQVDPFWAECQAKGEAARPFFVRNSTAIATALLSVTDERAKKSRHKGLVSAYTALRSKAIEHIGQAMPRFGDLVAKHAS